MISYITQRNGPPWGYPYVKHQPTRRHNTKDSHNTGNFAPYCDITVPDLVVAMKVALSAERRSLRIWVVAWRSPWVGIFDCSPPEVNGCRPLVLLALWVLVMLKNGLAMNEPWGTLAPTRQVDSLTVWTIHLFGWEILVSQSRQRDDIGNSPFGFSFLVRAYVGINYTKTKPKGWDNATDHFLT